MINLHDVLELKPSLMGSAVTGVTAVGAPVDTNGFGSVLAFLCAGAVAGTATNYVTLDVKVQESASATGTGTDWSDIGNGQVTGTFALDQITWFTGTNPTLAMGKAFEIMSDGVRARYIRAHATIAGTAGSGIKFCAGFLLGNPVNTDYIAKASTHASGNAQFYVGV